ncbi:flagellar basal body rod protein FlgC [Endozoicomonas ascidiicola]|uniref:flagellar basal body rod protein FlgC n=1 Tax=Endozoicomonas ascidiicola TaxID=1698521 RepID=UPI0008371AF2|nr:flagellar basal body rod protein FlgC [Endozoicomonas ascidiicola]
MSLNRIFDIAGSAMTAQSLRLNTVASNLANAETPAASAEEAYKARKPQFSAVLNQVNDEPASGYSVSVTEILESEAPAVARHQPYHPMADADGNVFYPNVNVVEEMADMMSASRNYQSNIEVMNSARQMQERLLSLGQ